MSDEHLSLTPSAPPTEADYEAIAAAVMETVRGRWFLAEYAKRNRNGDTDLILKGIDRIEMLLRERAPVSPAERVRIDLVAMAKAIARARSEIAAIRPDGNAKGTPSKATEELDSIVHRARDLGHPYCGRAGAGDRLVAARARHRRRNLRRPRPARQ